ncbi:MAG: hypothetical protein ACYTEQ_15875 [Planctomycetota bacterium]
MVVVRRIAKTTDASINTCDVDYVAIGEQIVTVTVLNEASVIGGNIQCSYDSVVYFACLPFNEPWCKGSGY